ncbi:PTS lactose/cellobiose transporter subunit IIA, partial [Oenococcus oeni]|uniref:PTS lactose/cellobiose transporter subunit IIA n=1 Tax=Oenococcus oeni TaxID=1247 RepID=UPI000A85D238
MSEEIENQKVIMSLINAGGNAKGASCLAIKAAKEKDFKEAELKLTEADRFLAQAHNAQTDM